MSRDERCATCEWWQAGAPGRAYAEALPGSPEMFLGACTVNPPIIVGADPHNAVALFPRTHENRRCGAWEKREPNGPDDGERAPTGFVVNLADRRVA